MCAAYRHDHYVPQFILRNFCAGGKLSVFDKTTNRSFRTNPRNVMGERGFNTVSLKDGAYVDFEQRFSFIEDKTAPIIKRIQESKTLEWLAPMDKATLACFLIIQFLRT